MSTGPELIGIAGTLGAGKDTVSNLLASQYGYEHVSTGDIVRSEAMRLHGSVDRRVLHEVANNLRIDHGAGALCLKAIEDRRSQRAQQAAGLVISGIRAIGEAEAIKSEDGLLVFVDAPVELRYDRLLKRARNGEFATTLEEFIAFETSELQSADEHGQNINGVRARSDLIIANDASMLHLTDQIETVLSGER